MANKSDLPALPVVMTSDDLSAFLKALRDCKENLHIYDAELAEVDGELQDVYHRLELKDGLTRKDMADAGSLIARLRKRRRIAKNAIERLKPVVDSLSQMPSALNNLNMLLGELRKIENRQKNRVYVPRGGKE